MEDYIPAIARWLGSNALVFFAVATAVALTLFGALWYLLIHHTRTLGRFAVHLWSSLAHWPPTARMHGALSGESRLVAYLTAYAVIAFFAAFAGLALFVELADEIEPGEDIAAFDDAFTASLRASTTQATLEFFKLATRLGDVAFLFAVATLVALVLIAKRKRLLAAIWIIATAGNGFLTLALKALFERTRPLHEHGLLLYEDWSFPSGHASGSLAVYTMLIYLALRGREVRWWHLPVLVVTMALVLMVGFSRVFLQVHYLSDVLAGYIVASSWLCVCIAGAEIAHARRSRVD